MEDIYIGTKLITAKAMNRLEYNEYRGWQLPSDENGSDEGYLVEYLDGGKPNHPNHKGYISWSPKEQFEKAYRKTSGLTFGLAIEALILGMKVARTGWNGKGMFVYYVPANKYIPTTQVARSHFGEDALVPYNAYLAIKNVDNSVSTWVPSINDCLAEDWQTVE